MRAEWDSDLKRERDGKMNGLLKPERTPDREELFRRYHTGRFNLLIVIVLTVLNIILVVTGANKYYLFSASIPYYIAYAAAYASGRFPSETYEGLESDMVYKDTGYLIAMTVIALVLLSFYLLAFFLSKHRPAWLTLSLIFIVIDTVALILLFGMSLSSAVDLICHGIVIYELVSAVKASKGLKSAPPAAASRGRYEEE